MKIESRFPGPIYLDASAVAKIYLPEPDSKRVDRLLHDRMDLMISDLTVTEIVSALARRWREGVIRIDDARRFQKSILNDIECRVFRHVELLPEVFCQAERILLSVESISLRAADSLHLALALSGKAQSVFTFDARLAEAARVMHLDVVG